MSKAAIKRIEHLSKRSKLPSSVIARGVTDAVDNLFQAIEMLHLASVAAMDSPSDGQEREDFTPLVDEMNELTDMFRRSIARRKANNRRKFLKKQQAAQKAELAKTEKEEKETATVDVVHNEVVDKNADDKTDADETVTATPTITEAAVEAVVEDLQTIALANNAVNEVPKDKNKKSEAKKIDLNSAQATPTDRKLTHAKEKETSATLKELVPIVEETEKKKTTEEYATNIVEIMDEKPKKGD